MKKHMYVMKEWYHKQLKKPDTWITGKSGKKIIGVKSKLGVKQMRNQMGRL
jgi:hypothetical protein